STPPPSPLSLHDALPILLNGAMPPWHADPAHGEFANDRRLSAADKETIASWVNAGSPEGDPADLPSQPKYVEGWQIGQPDAVVRSEEHTSELQSRFDLVC